MNNPFLFFYYWIASLNALPALNAGALEAAILMVSPVLGLIPFLAARALTSNVPKPTTATFLPAFNSSAMLSITAANALSASF